MTNNLIKTIQTLSKDGVNELKMHKILYYIYGFYYKKYAEEIFIRPNFQAWKLGPAEVDYRYGHDTKKFDYDLNEEKEAWLIKTIKALLEVEVYTLVNASHKTKPYINAGAGKIPFATISNNDIKEYFKNEN